MKYMLIKLFLISLLVFTYVHLILHFTITKENSIYRLEDVTKENVHNEIRNKVPFYFKGSTIQSSLLFSDYKKSEEGYLKMYENIELLEPTMWFEVEIKSTKEGDFFYKKSIDYNKKSKSITKDDLF